MLLQFLPQQGNQGAVAERVLVRNAQHNEGFAAQLPHELLVQAVSVAALHHEYDFGPAQVPGRDPHPRARLGTSRAGFVVRVAVEKPLGGEAAPLVLAADEEEAHGRGMNNSTSCRACGASSQGPRHLARGSNPIDPTMRARCFGKLSMTFSLDRSSTESAPLSPSCLSLWLPASGPGFLRPGPRARPRSCGGRTLRCGPRPRAPCRLRSRRLRPGRPG